jgi:hypothetical protein
VYLCFTCYFYECRRLWHYFLDSGFPDRDLLNQQPGNIRPEPGSAPDAAAADMSQSQIILNLNRMKSKPGVQVGKESRQTRIA